MIRMQTQFQCQTNETAGVGNMDYERQTSGTTPATRRLQLALTTMGKTAKRVHMGEGPQHLGLMILNLSYPLVTQWERQEGNLTPGVKMSFQLESNQPMD